MDWNNLVAEADSRYQQMMASLVETSDFSLSNCALNDEDSCIDPFNFIGDIYTQDNRIRIMSSLTGFTVDEFEQLWTIARRDIPIPKRGKK